MPYYRGDDEEDDEDNRAPSCYGDPYVYNPDRARCIDCAFRPTCRQVVRRKKRAADRKAKKSGSQSSLRVPKKKPVNRRPPEPDPEDYNEEEDHGLSFFKALVLNSTLSAAESVAGEVHFSLKQIPRAAYPNPFERVMRPPRRRIPKRRDDDDDDDDYDE